jgi:hypothetical protein
MKYVKGSVFPYTEKHLRTDNPNTSFPKNALRNENLRADYGVEEVLETDIPTKNGYKAVQGEIAIVDGKKVEAWDLVLKEVEELFPKEITQVDPTPPEGHWASHGTPELVGDEWKQTWVYEQAFGIEARVLSYGPPTDQIEFITENGLEAWQTKVAEIKAKYPKV